MNIYGQIFYHNGLANGKFPGTYICPFVLANAISIVTASRYIYNSCSSVVSFVKLFNLN